MLPVPPFLPLPACARRVKENPHLSAAPPLGAARGTPPGAFPGNVISQRTPKPGDFGVR